MKLRWLSNGPKVWHTYSNVMNINDMNRARVYVTKPNVLYGGMQKKAGLSDSEKQANQETDCGYNSRKRANCWSLSDTIGSWMPQSIFRSGSFQMIPDSQALL